MTVDGIETNSFIAAVEKANSKHSVARHVAYHVASRAGAADIHAWENSFVFYSCLWA